MSDTLMISVSGIRGLVGIDLTPEMVARWAAAFGTWSREQGAGSRKSKHYHSLLVPQLFRSGFKTIF